MDNRNCTILWLKHHWSFCRQVCLRSLNLNNSIVKNWILTDDLLMTILNFKILNCTTKKLLHGPEWNILFVLPKRLKLKSAVDIYISALSNLKASGIFHDISIDRLFGNIPQLYQENIWKLAVFDLAVSCLTLCDLWAVIIDLNGLGTFQNVNERFIWIYGKRVFSHS